MSGLDEKFNTLFQEWEVYHFAFIRFKDINFDSSLEYIIDHDGLKKQANMLYEAYITGTLDKQMIDCFENSLSDFRSKTTFNILQDGKIRERRT